MLTVLRRRALVLAAAGSAVISLYFLALPNVEKIGGGSCDDQHTMDLDKGELLSIRAPQHDRGEYRRYDAANDTTLIVPGCSHWTASFAVVVRGDLTGIGRYQHLVLAPTSNWDGETVAVDPPMRPGFSEHEDVAQALSVTFEPRSGAVHFVVAGLAAILFAAALGHALDLAPASWRFSPPLGTMVGIAVMMLSLALDGWFLGVLVGVLAALAGAICLTVSKKRPQLRVAAWTMLALVGGVAAFVAVILDVFPGSAPAA